MKTYDEWEATEVSLTQYLQPCDEIDEELYDHMGGVVSPQYCTQRLLQSGEPEREERGVMHYLSFMAREDGKYFYLGILPKFKQPKH
ncbi:hypothetical protein [Hymenobacter metallicola]|uniref:Uncharacterized protein n=1 Tax=Hymenobacter metallicola TaxID=2563114 RepID=A0A4Z0PYL2_9BACT|nr:hypothetical protein [Hymenobacter metallicola]TGE22807.1 hypothetical protein E5K02_20800 [Hymenobacter metallicola]